MLTPRETREVKELETRIRKSAAGLPLKQLIRDTFSREGIELTRSNYKNARRILSDIPGIIVANGVVLAEGPDIDDPDASGSTGNSNTTIPAISNFSIGPSNAGTSPNAITIEKITGLLTGDPIRYLDPSSQLYRNTLACKNAIGTGIGCPKPSFDGLTSGAKTVSVTFNSVTNQNRTLTGNVSRKGGAGFFSIPISMNDILFMGRGEHQASVTAFGPTGSTKSELYTFYVALPLSVLPDGT